jgi:hypothetical protein
MLINLHARVRARCVGALISSYVMALAMGPHPRTPSGRPARIWAQAPVSMAENVVPEPVSTASCMEVDKAALKCDRLPVQLHALP